jgi:hypothetical protein
LGVSLNLESPVIFCSYIDLEENPMDYFGTRDLLRSFSLLQQANLHPVVLGCTGHAYDKAKSGAALIAHLRVHNRLDPSSKGYRSASFDEIPAGTRTSVGHLTRRATIWPEWSILALYVATVRLRGPNPSVLLPAHRCQWYGMPYQGIAL